MRVRRAEVSDAAAIALVHVRSWQAAYHGLIPQDFLDGLDTDDRRDAWERGLADRPWPRSETFVAEGEEGIVGFATSDRAATTTPTARSARSRRSTPCPPYGAPGSGGP